MKYLKWVLIFLAAAVALYFGYRTIQKINEQFSDWEEEVADKEAELARLKAAADQQVADFLEREGAWKEQRTRDSTEIAALTVEVNESSAAADSLGKELRVKLPVKFRAQFDQLIAAHQAQVQAILARERRKDSRIAYLESELEQSAMDYHELNRTMTDALARSEELKEFWKGKAKRKWYEKPQFIAPVTVGLTLTGVALVNSAIN